MKTEILTLLRETDGYVSGQELCEKFGVSRTAVWKAINQLKEAGYEIEAVQNKGYRLVSVPDILSESELQSVRKTRWIGEKIAFFDVVDSTNTRAKQLAEEGAPNGTYVIAERQDAGKGRRGRGFDSPAGQGIWMTLVLKPEIDPNHASMITLVTALAVSKAITDMTGRPAGIKWPNDIYWKDRKICGMLIENTLVGRCIENCIIGAGININQQTFCSDAPNPVSLRQITGKEQEPVFILADTVKRFKDYYRKIQQGQTEDIVRNYRERLYRYNGFHLYQDADGVFEAEIHDVEPTGHLVLADRDGVTRRYAFKEVSHLIPSDTTPSAPFVL